MLEFNFRHTVFCEFIVNGGIIDDERRLVFEDVVCPTSWSWSPKTGLVTGLIRFELWNRWTSVTNDGWCDARSQMAITFGHLAGRRAALTFFATRCSIPCLCLNPVVSGKIPSLFDRDVNHFVGRFTLVTDGAAKMLPTVSRFAKAAAPQLVESELWRWEEACFRNADAVLPYADWLEENGAFELAEMLRKP